MHVSGGSLRPLGIRLGGMSQIAFVQQLFFVRIGQDGHSFIGPARVLATAQKVGEHHMCHLMRHGGQAMNAIAAEIDDPTRNLPGGAEFHETGAKRLSAAGADSG